MELSKIPENQIKKEVTPPHFSILSAVESKGSIIDIINFVKTL